MKQFYKTIPVQNAERLSTQKTGTLRSRGYTDSELSLRRDDLRVQVYKKITWIKQELACGISY
jgi:hypothetical protein